MPPIIRIFLVVLFISLRNSNYSEPLTLFDCFSLSLRYNPKQTSAFYNMQVKREDSLIQKSSYYPEIYASAHGFKWQTHNFLQIDAPPPIPPNILPSLIGPTEDYGYLISGRYTLFDFGEAKERYLAARALFGAASFEKERIQEEILLNVATLFFELASHEELVNVAKKNLKRTESHLKLVQDKREVGSAPLSDILRSKVEVADAKLNLVRTESRVLITQGRLKEALGFDAFTPLRINAKRTKQEKPLEKELLTARQFAFSKRPELKVNMKKIQALCHKLESIRSSNLPKVTALGAYGRRDSDFLPHDEEWLFGLCMEMPLFTGFRLTHEEAKVRAEICEARADIASLRLMIDQEITTAFSRLREAYELIEATSVQVEDASESLRLIEKRYQSGVSTVTDLLDAETALLRAEATQVNAEWSFEKATYAFLWTQGLLSDFLEDP